MALDYGNYVVFLMMGNAGSISSTVVVALEDPLGYESIH